MTKEINPDQNRISLKQKTVNVLLDSARNELNRLMELPEVKRAILLKETLANMQPESIPNPIVQREPPRGSDKETRIMRTVGTIEQDREHVLNCVIKHSPISLSELYKLFRPGEKRSDHLYKAMYSDVIIHLNNGRVSKAKNLITATKQGR